MLHGLSLSHGVHKHTHSCTCVYALICEWFVAHLYAPSPSQMHNYLHVFMLMHMCKHALFHDMHCECSFEALILSIPF